MVEVWYTEIDAMEGIDAMKGPAEYAGEGGGGAKGKRGAKSVNATLDPDDCTTYLLPNILQHMRSSFLRANLIRAYWSLSS